MKPTTPMLLLVLTFLFILGWYIKWSRVAFKLGKAARLMCFDSNYDLLFTYPLTYARSFYDEVNR